eukprot:CAMPEP_0181340266 /NCGR_PEP_ID=MMETSP1101-20121128/29745_1 /TAXON_ID=46948 /ORGANISM="Rhodomonas abbreviata, Strain Caron Lab Isolate" /LENGTH=145 /DNA_ID=CAMNT_0023451385 /DNA_START=363 /DNA_END=797 /DNA_ORIENTATION=+
MRVVGIALPWIAIWWFEAQLDLVAPTLFLTMAEELIDMIGEVINVAWPMKVLCSLLYNGYRLMALRAWFDTVCLSSSADAFSGFHQLTAAANLFLWSFHLIAVLIPLVLVDTFHPKYRPALGPETLKAEGAVVLELAQVRGGEAK